MTRPAKLYQRVVDMVAAGIAGGRYPAGSRLPSERDLAAELGVSRPTVREAMLALEIRGLIAARRGSGIYVTDTAPADVAALELDIGAFELTEARLLFEGEAAAFAATAIDDAGLEALDQILHAMAAGDPGGMTIEQDDRRFHVGIATATGNSAIASVVETLWDMRYRSPLCMHMFGKARREGVNPRIDEHRLILDALSARDPAAARAAMHAHLRRVTDDILAATDLDADTGDRLPPPRLRLAD